VKEIRWQDIIYGIYKHSNTKHFMKPMNNSIVIFGHFQKTVQAKLMRPPMDLPIMMWMPFGMLMSAV
jgi:hypothetical protein